MDWIIKNLSLTREGTDIVFSVDNMITVLTPVNSFIEMFGEVIQTAIDNEEDVKQAIIDSDPDNTKGFNDLLQEHKANHFKKREINKTINIPQYSKRKI